MNIEIVEFYITFRDDSKLVLKGTLHVYLCDYKIDLRGIFVTKIKDSWFFRIPHQRTIDQETGEEVFYPVMSFIDKEQHTKLINAIRDKGKKYVEDHISEIGNQKCG